MPDFEFTLTKVNPDKTAIVRSVTLENYSPQQVTFDGIESLMRWAEEDPESGIPKAAVDYWDQNKHGGPLYEAQSGLTERFGISFGVKEINNEPAPKPMKAAPKSSPTRPKAENKQLNLRNLLAQHLEYLQDRQKELTAERKLIDREMNENRDSINEIMSFMAVSATQKAKRKKADAVG